MVRILKDVITFKPRDLRQYQSNGFTYLGLGNEIFLSGLLTCP